jgi:3-hydroxyisobutyrate dehydrogenase-like beta-hydroxyacid dehydrogenase
MARALIVGCGCRGRSLGRRLLDGGWAVRGTTRDEGGVEEIEKAGIEGRVADPGRLITLVDHIDEVAIVCWLLGSATGDAEDVAALHGSRLERLCEELVDTPVRGIVYEAEGSLDKEVLAGGAEVLTRAEERWRIPYALVRADPADPGAWTDAAAEAVTGLVA